MKSSMNFRIVLIQFVCIGNLFCTSHMFEQDTVTPAKERAALCSVLAGGGLTIGATSVCFTEYLSKNHFYCPYIKNITRGAGFFGLYLCYDGFKRAFFYSRVKKMDEEKPVFSLKQ